MLLRSVFLKGLRDLRRAFPFWAIGAAIMPITLGLLYPSIEKASADVQRYIEAMPEAFVTMFVGAARDFTSPVGYMDAELFSFMAPIVFVAFGISLGVSQIAGEEEQGTLSLLLSYPRGRTRLLLEKGAVLVAGLVLLTLAQLVAMIIGVRIGGAELGFGTILEGHVMLFLLTLAVSAVAFAVGAATGHRGVALGVGAIVALGSYLLNALAPLNQTIAPLQKASLFYYYGGTQPLRQGADLGYAAVLLAVTAIAAVIAVAAFARRDIRV
jgi:ABC-2 type transport system permease protein